MSCPKGSLKIKDVDLTNKRILVLGKGTLCEELRAADIMRCSFPSPRARPRRCGAT